MNQTHKITAFDERYWDRHTLVNSVNRSNRAWDSAEIDRHGDPRISKAEIVRHNGLRAMLQVAALHMDGLG